MDDRLLTPAQVAERLQVAANTIYIWLRTGRLPGSKLGRLWRISQRDFEAFLRKRHNAAASTTAGQES